MTEEKHPSSHTSLLKLRSTSKATKGKRKSGFAVIIGRSNVGKSTLLNALIGTKLAIITEKSQTTRHSIHGVFNDERGQIVFVDTPGVLLKSRDRLTKALNKKVKESLEGIDVILYLADPTRTIGNEEQVLLRMIEKVKVPKILVINKIDVYNAKYLDDYRDMGEGFDEVIEISALQCKHIKGLVNLVFENLSEGEPLYPDFQITNVENKFWFAEIIREKIFHQFYQEVPYNINVKVEEIEERENGLLYIRAIIEVIDVRYKKMVLGHGGRKIKEIGTTARHDLEKITSKKIFLDLEVEVNKRWVENL